ncbi:DNA topology modulation protein FlaR [Sporolactobacillus shoreicorticis]|uniref:AAA family ATPase n=1 Tax=Sporolactobacillus shoreicorticis TaxID=1923877 RepID=A0ABW5S2H1_9BACL|nr:AAA family ATPase [Sporolactobacillus shoreicorticis]MCO7127083.1 DNA topology modulation protein FlaR [Sporolactobacillus shoreicorticis]
MKIYIIGSVGSGKTTLARNIAKKTEIAAYELDNVVWEHRPDGDRRRIPAERDAILQDILKKDSWIIEGAQYADWVLPALRSADRIIFLDPPNRVIQHRIVKRFIQQKLHLEEANYRPTFHMLWMMFQWSAQFQKEGRSQILHMLNSFQEKTVILKVKKDLNKTVSL